MGEDFREAFDVEYISAHPHKEIVLFFKKEKTLIEADLFFNLPSIEQYSRSGESATGGLITKIFVWLWGTGGSARAQKWFVRRVFARGGGDLVGWGESVRRIHEWGFERVVPCHGQVVERGGGVVLRGCLGSTWVEGDFGWVDVLVEVERVVRWMVDWHCGEG